MLLYFNVNLFVGAEEAIGGTGAQWVTDVGNERGEILQCVLTVGEHQFCPSPNKAETHRTRATVAVGFQFPKNEWKLWNGDMVLV